MRSGSRASSPRSRPRRAYPEITRAGRRAGFVTAACLMVVAVAYAVAATDELTCRGPTSCTREAGVGGLAWFGSVLAFGFAVAAVLSIRRRPVDEDGSSAWTWGLAVLFVAGAWLAVTRIPSLSCPPGYHLDVGFRLCIRGPDRFDATGWVWLKTLLWAVSAIVGVTAIREPRAMPWSAMASAGVWFLGTGWILHDTLWTRVR